MITFLQLNYDLIVAAFALLGIYWIAFTYLIEIRGILITTFVAIMLSLSWVGFSRTLHNQVPKTTIDRTYLEKTTDSYQDRVNRAK